MRSGSATILAHGHARVQRRVGILEDDLHSPADVPQVTASGRGGLAVKRTLPPSARPAAITVRPSVVLPQPDSPTSPSVSPLRTEDRPRRPHGRLRRCPRRFRPDRKVLDEPFDPEQCVVLDGRGALGGRARSSRGRCCSCPSLQRGRAGDAMRLGELFRVVAAGDVHRGIADGAQVRHHGATGEPSARHRAAGMEDAARGRRDSSEAGLGSAAVDSCPRRAAPDCRSGRPCRDGSARRRSCNVGPSSTIRPPYITTPSGRRSRQSGRGRG